MEIGIWIDPKGEVHDVYADNNSHAAFAMRLSSLDDPDDAIGELLSLGWIRVSMDTIQLARLGAREKALLAKALHDVDHSERMTVDESKRISVASFGEIIGGI